VVSYLILITFFLVFLCNRAGWKTPYSTYRLYEDSGDTTSFPFRLVDTCKSFATSAEWKRLSIMNIGSRLDIRHWRNTHSCLAATTLDPFPDPSLAIQWGRHHSGHPERIIIPPIPWRNLAQRGARYVPGIPHKRPGWGWAYPRRSLSSHLFRSEIPIARRVETLDLVPNSARAV
jgi:hypothetical protein